jgi:hypothetical protein
MAVGRTNVSTIWKLRVHINHCYKNKRVTGLIVIVDYRSRQQSVRLKVPITAVTFKHVNPKVKKVPTAATKYANVDQQRLAGLLFFRDVKRQARKR